MNKKTKIILSAVALLAVAIVIIIVVRRRGRKADGSESGSTGSVLSGLFRKKVYLKDGYRLNNNYVIWIVDNPEESLGSDTFYQGTLDYVLVPSGATQTTDSGGFVWTPVTGVGLVVHGKKVKILFGKTRYIESKYLSL